MTKPVLLFDLYGVLLQLQTPAQLRRIEQTLGVGDELWPVYWQHRAAFDAGELTPADYWATVARDLGVDPHSYDVDAVIAADLDSWLDADETMVAYVSNLVNDGYKVGLLSNIPQFLADKVAETHEFLQTFHAVLFSCDLGLAKPDLKIYQVAAAALGEKPEAITFFDDTIDNVAAARKAGMNAVRFTGIACVQRIVDAAAESSND
ncbi:HAD family hydrolase [Corynebacterium choanae]|uniref:(S)-2-haloacid dehalogenase 4A n=1 Tax=Corynebacterium choanae TaxID=1862358 RepID=A0A3G6JC96_9CORY|nr:HAD family phosphatase [Corynebacterium choanae]AZA14678.1 (S)-2-haloacid dehalogenase 4A [Corynebacterium choanae]